jgi:signal transduction histidine kinase
VAVPGDVAVVGFDDIVDAAGHGLTTIRQPLRGMGRDAVRLLLARLRGEAVPAVTLFPATPVLRTTCGCTDVGAGAWRPARALATCATPAALAEQLAYQFPDMAARLGVPRWADALAGGALGGDGGDAHPFLAALAGLLDQAGRRVPEPRDWYRLVRASLEPLRHGDEAARARAAELSDAAHELVGTTAANREMLRRARAEEEMRALRRLVEPIPLPDEVFRENLLGGLPVLGMRSFFLARYVAPDRREAELFAHFDLDGAVALDDEHRRFPACELVPGRFSGARRAYVVVPVHSPAELLGYALCEIGPMNASGYEMLLHELSTVLGVNRLMAELSERHRQLLEAARQAGMAEVAVGALHNVGNLLNSVSVSAEEIHAAALAAERSGFVRATALLTEHAHDLPGFFAHDPRAALLPGYLGKAADALTQELARVRTEAGELLERTGLVRESIRALQDHARGAREQLLRERFGVAEIVRSALEIQRPHLERYGVEVRQELAAVPPLLAPRSKLVHVLVNLLKNAAESMLSTPEGQRVITVVAAARSDGSLELQVRDRGEGIAAENLPKVFTYGFTTKRDGHGFGLHTCANYMRQMGGTIEVQSAGPGQGATFTLTFGAAAGAKAGTG